METPRDFTAFVKKNCQTLIFERSLKDMLNMKNDRCPGTNCQKKKDSCTQAILILPGNDIEEEIRFFSPNVNALPLIFNKRGSTYEKANEFSLTSPLTVFFWCTSNINLEIVQSVPLKKNAGLLKTCLKPAWDDCLEEANLAVWKNKGESINSSEYTNRNCSFKTNTVFHIRKDRQPLTLVQLCYTELLANILENCEGKQLIDIREIVQKASVKMSIIRPDYHEIVLVLNPVIVKRMKDYDLPVQRYRPFNKILKFLLKALK
jgi:hypothetical protein